MIILKKFPQSILFNHICKIFVTYSISLKIINPEIYNQLINFIDKVKTRYKIPVILLTPYNIHITRKNVIQNHFKFLPQSLNYICIMKKFDIIAKTQNRFRK